MATGVAMASFSSATGLRMQSPSPRTLLPRLPSRSISVYSSFQGQGEGEEGRGALTTGSAVVIIEAPPMLKTAEPMPMMRPNFGAIKPGDAGRVIGRCPKDVWAVRFAIGAYLIDRKYFKPLDAQS